jgi:predicted DNA-binding transcriptional regulator AlpA
LDALNDRTETGLKRSKAPVASQIAKIVRCPHSHGSEQRGDPMSDNSHPPLKLLLVRDDLIRYGIDKSNTTLLRWESLGRFPRRLRMAGTSVCWLSSEIDAWLAERAKERETHVYAEY